MAYYEVEKGENSNRIDLFFNEKPDNTILEELKSTGWRWYGYKRCWYTYDSENYREQAERFCQMVNNDEIDLFEYYQIRDNYFQYLDAYGRRLSMSNEKIRSLAKRNASKVSQYYSGKKYYVNSILKDIKNNNAVAVDMGNKNYEIYDEEYEEFKEEFLNLLEERNFYFEDEVIVKQNCFNCEDSDHHIDDYCGMINVLNRKLEIEKFKIWVGYCNECEEFFIMKNDFLAIKQKGVLLCNLISESSGSHSSFDNAEYLNDEFILKQYDYHVGKNSALTEEQRRTILALLLDSNIVSKGKIISLLNYFIGMRENSKYDFSQAISDWESDIRFVSNYKLDEKNQILLKVIRSKW